MTISLDFGYAEQRFILIVGRAMMVSVGPANDLKSTIFRAAVWPYRATRDNTEMKKKAFELNCGSDDSALVEVRGDDVFLLYDRAKVYAADDDALRYAANNRHADVVTLLEDWIEEHG
jgi:hypothetical protein